VVIPVELVYSIAFLVLLFVLISLLSSGSENKAFPYEAQRFLFTPAERSFYGVLQSAVSDRYVVFGKVRMGDVLKVLPRLGTKNAIIARSKIQQKHLDFVLCKKDTLEVVCCIELNDRSHERPDRVKRDNFVRAAFKQANVVLVEFQVRSTYNRDVVLEQILSAVAKVKDDPQPTALPVKLEPPSPISPLPIISKKELEGDKLSTSKLAKKHGISVAKCQELLLKQGYIRFDGQDANRKYHLTDAGMAAGGEIVNHPKYGEYLSWPPNIFLDARLNS